MDIKISPKHEKAKTQLGGLGYPCPELRLATAYIPPQLYGRQFPLEEALDKGTLWPELYRPYTCPEDPHYYAQSR
ncbi:MAG: spore coat associated protein CotJA [Bacillota bacterium]